MHPQNRFALFPIYLYVTEAEQMVRFPATCEALSVGYLMYTEGVNTLLSFCELSQAQFKFCDSSPMVEVISRELSPLLRKWFNDAASPSPITTAASTASWRRSEGRMRSQSMTLWSSYPLDGKCWTVWLGRGECDAWMIKVRCRRDLCKVKEQVMDGMMGGNLGPQRNT